MKTIILSIAIIAYSFSSIARDEQSPIDIYLGTAADFILFTGAEAIANTGISDITGDVGSHVGAIAGYGPPTILDGTIQNTNSITAQALLVLASGSSYEIATDISTRNINAAGYNLVDGDIWGSFSSPEMKVLPVSDTNPVLSNIELSSSETFCATQATADLITLYNELIAYPGGVTHPLVFGNGEVLSPGVYDIGGAQSISGTLTMDGGGDPNSLFIIRGPGAFTTVAGSTVVLTGNAKPENIFWVSSAAMSTGASTIMKGTLVGGGGGAGAVSLGANTNHVGRMFTKLGAVSVGASSILAIPTGTPFFNLRSLSTFVMWSSGGALSDSASSDITGDVGTASGALAIAGTHNGAVYHPGIDYCALNPTIWIGEVSTVAENINNWTKGFPNRDIDVVINITPNDPIFSENIEIQNLSIATGASVSQANESQIDVYGDFQNNGTYNPGNSTLAFKGDEIQNFSTNNTISVYNLTIDNDNSLNLLSGNVDVFNSLNLTTGDLITNYDHTIPGNNLVTFKSSATNTAIISEIKNSNTVVGEVMIERYIPMRNRAFRFMTTSVTTTTSIKDNWQEGVNNTVNDYEQNLNPNTGYGTHITGSTTGDNGFDATFTGNPSLFEWESQNGSWSTILNTDTNTLEAGKAYGILIRGDRATNIYVNNNSRGGDTNLRSLGIILTGDVNIDADLNPNPDGFSLIGNPYQAEVDMKKTLANSSKHLDKKFYYAYRPNLGTRGGFVAVDLNANPVEGVPNDPTDENTIAAKFRYLQVNQSVYVQTDQNIQPTQVPLLTFKEKFKTDQSSTNVVFRDVPTSKVDLNIFSNSNNKLMDGVRFKFDATYDEEAGTDDALKFWNDDETIGIQSDGNYLAIEKRPFPKDEDIFSFWIGNYRDIDYIMNVEVESMSDYVIFLKDTYTEVDHQLNEGENDIAFSIDSSVPASINSDRFKIQFEKTTLGTSQNEMAGSSQIYPNPSNSGFAYLLHNPDFNSELKVSVFNILGQSIAIPKDRLSSSELKLNTSSLNSGIYLIKLTYQTQTTTHKLIIE
ncbi:secreted ice-binding cell surface protein (Por secretion system C-terminal sorting domain) [Psychroflexus torquis ATCC 700755]|uniref:Secreted ice-binding cell surface protein (Por secretion system C-terminal sorting domain) n=1 Tax=Psychroflexus torquis (strain ATCC 700755 / CIP 106069 / ACAM 623) TaxID=313595 RepID=K4I9X0_PSYTT|nr:ice-binding family protein [Psychroflexus torquis]AFU67219.1 secreted ice-binding cell surface protein (Por secretion system C-terminal sorting domain) [Psychroflexus torquis ATCC 700755]